MKTTDQYTAEARAKLGDRYYRGTYFDAMREGRTKDHTDTLMVAHDMVMQMAADRRKAKS